MKMKGTVRGKKFMKKKTTLMMAFCMILILAGCSRESKEDHGEETQSAPVIEIEEQDEVLESDSRDTVVTETVLEEQPVEDEKTDSSENENDFISRHGSLKIRETESTELNNSMWSSFESYNKSTNEYGDYRSETEGEFKNASIKFGEMGEGVLYLGDEEIKFTYVLAEYPTKAEGKTESGEDISMEFYTFNFDGSDIESVKLEIGEWSIDFWPVG